jgi:hypothetical protein
MTPEERARLDSTCGLSVGGFCVILAPPLLKEPPPPTEPRAPTSRSLTGNIKQSPTQMKSPVPLHLLRHSASFF